MAKELFIVFLYDTEIVLREEEDPQAAVVYFHPSWVNANQRMALCGQLIGVTQFLTTGFSFPHTISLDNGKFAIKKLGRFILCVGTDRNVGEWILVKRCELLFNTLQFFHNDLDFIIGSSERKIINEKLANVMEVYLPVLLHGGNLFGNTFTIRLPKSASTVFLEAAQLLECLQNDEDVYGGAIFYQNKIVLSQLNAHIAKQLVVTDPYRVKIPAERRGTSFELPHGVQLLVVYVDESELTSLGYEKLSLGTNRKMVKTKERSIEDLKNDFSKRASLTKTSDRSRIFTVMEEEYDSEQPARKLKELSQMPDLVKDTVKTVKEKLEKKKRFSDIKIKSFIVDSFDKLKVPSSSSYENLLMPQNETIKYHSFQYKNFNEENKSSNNTAKCKKKSKFSNYYNTISDPLYPWFRENGLPVSKALKDSRFTDYYQNINTIFIPEKTELLKNGDCIEFTTSILKRPTSIQLKREDVKKDETTVQKCKCLLKDLKRAFTDSPSQFPVVIKDSTDVPLTPLMSKLSMSDLTQLNLPSVLTQAPSLRMLCDEMASKEDIHQKFKHQMKYGSRRRKSALSPDLKRKKRVILFVIGHQNISIYLLLNEDNSTNEEFIKKMWNICMNSIKDIEIRLQQCLDTVPQGNAMNSFNESYNYLNIHSVWETLDHGGIWTGPQLELLNTIHNDFNCDITLTDMIFRLDDNIIYGNQVADNQLFYLQNVSSIAGLPMPSDVMGTVSLKAKRRLERDRGLLIA